MSKVSPFSFSYPPQSGHKISDSALNANGLNPFITGHESRKQFAIGLTVEQISQVYQKAASATRNGINENSTKNKTDLRKGRSQIKSNQSEIKFETQSQERAKTS